MDDRRSLAGNYSGENTAKHVFAMNESKGKTRAASQKNSATVIHQTSTNEAQRIVREIDAYAQSRSACIQRQQWLREQLAKINAALASEPARKTATARRDRKYLYGELTAALKEVLQSGALTKREIVARLQKRNFLNVPQPLKTLDSVIYTLHFKRNGKLFSLASPQK